MIHINYENDDMTDEEMSLEEKRRDIERYPRRDYGNLNSYEKVRLNLIPLKNFYRN